MKLKVYSFISAYLFSFATLSSEVITRAAIDIGSGDTKMTVATVDTETNQIAKILYQNYITVELRKDLGASPDKSLSPKIEQELINALRKMQENAEQYNPVEWVCVGTSVFRTAKNGAEFLAKIKAATDIEVRIVPQAVEGEIGFASAIAASGKNSESIIAWDSGSGSFQLTTLLDGQLKMYGAEFAYVPALEALFAIRNRPFSADVSANPVSLSEALLLIGAIRRLCGSSDEQFKNYAKPKEVVVALILLYAVMDHCGFEQVNYYPTNGGSEGLLIIPSFWN